MKALMPGLQAALALSVAACVASQVSPQEGIPQPEAGRPDPGAVQLVDGQVLGVDRRPPSEALGSSVRLTLGGKAGVPVSVTLGPGWYLDQQGLHFAPNERVHVRGTRIEQNGRSSIVAQEITAGGRVVRLRDAAGRPLWGSPPPAR